MDSESKENYGMVKLTSTNYSRWKSRMTDLLYCKDLFEPIEGEEGRPEGKSDAQWKIMNRKASALIRTWVDESVYHHVEDETDACKLWKKLESMYERKTAQNKATLIRKLVNLKYRDGRSVSEHLSEFQGLVNQLASMKMVLEEELKALLLLSSLPDSWNTLVVSLSNSTPDGSMTMQMVETSLLNEEDRRREQGTHTSTSEALVVEKRGRNQSRGNSNRDKSRSGRSKSRQKEERECFHCHKVGHIKKNCFVYKKEMAKESGSTNTSVTVVSDNEEVLICEESWVNMMCSDTQWVVDSGASFHVASRRDCFKNYTTGEFGRVIMGNGKESKVEGKGDVHLETNTGVVLVLKNVRHVPDMRLNLISIGVLDDEGYHSAFGDQRWKLAKGALIFARGKKENALYITRARVEGGEVNALSEDSIELWHKRLGHMSEKGLQVLGRREAISGVKGASLKTCEHCMAGKQHRVSFQKHVASRRPSVLDVVYSDVCGPMSTQTLGGARYFVSFIDDHSRKVWAYPIKTKDQVLGVFESFHALVERETGKKMKCIRTDNGGEYIGAFREFCAKLGIRHERSVPKTPQHNGIAERMNRTIVERIRCMLSHAKLPKTFWGEALMAAVAVINISPSAPLNGEVPNRVWYDKEVSYGNLRVFGCKAYVHIPKDERTKLDVKTKQCIFLRNGKEEFGYRLWSPTEKKIIRSRDVVFVEDETIEDINSDNSKEISFEGQRIFEPNPTPPLDNVDEVRNVEVEQEEGEEVLEEQIPPQPEEEPEEEPQVRRSTRERVPSRLYSPNEYVMLTDEGEPESYEEAMGNDKREEWLGAMKDEMTSLHENSTYDLVKLPKGKRALNNKWVFKLKTQENTSQPKYKARLVVKGFGQKSGIDYEEIFSPVVKMSSIRVVLGLAASLNLEVEQLDVKTAFLHGDLEEEIYMKQPEGFEVKGKEDFVCKLKKSLYGLKQAPRQWYKKFESFMVEHGYQRTTSDHCVFVKKFPGEKFIILLLYVDDMLVVGQDCGEIRKLKIELSKAFAMKDLGSAKQILGVHITRDRVNRKIYLSQEKYIERVLHRFNMEHSKPVGTPLASHLKLGAHQMPTSDEEKEEMEKVPYASAVGSLMYAMICTRPDISYAVGVVSRYIANPGREHWDGVKWILRYLRGTSKVQLCFGSEDAVVVGYTDADMAGDTDSRKSTSGYLVTLAGGAVAWQSRLQKCVALSTTEAEFIAATEACKELLWLKRFLQELGHGQEKYTLFCDSQSAIHLSKNSSFHSRSKHIDVRYHWIRDVLESKQLKLEKIHTDDNGSDMMTKSLTREKHEICRRVSGMTEPQSSSAWGRFVGSSLMLEEEEPRGGRRPDGREGSGRKACPRFPESKQASGRSELRLDGSHAR